MSQKTNVMSRVLSKYVSENEEFKNFFLTYMADKSVAKLEKELEDLKNTFNSFKQEMA